MDRFFPEKLLGEIFWDESLLATNQSDFLQNSQFVKDQPFLRSTQSAFVQYRELPIINSPKWSNSQTMSKRMIAFLRKSLTAESNTGAEHERERCFRHMINERMRRQRQRQCCLALHALLPHGTKTDNNSVIQMAAKEIIRLQGCREELQRKNVVLEANLEDVKSNRVEGSKVQFLRVPYPTSGIDSMIETLKCLKYRGVDTRSIKSTFSPHELFAALETETKVADAEVERAIWSTLDELEWSFLSHAIEGSKRQRLDLKL
ncbi:transcription factor bHLH92 [Abrus precatorius]|uniref:Transcription factor bHLH92 n=1 Tax=Abrus precatorius TaxID=3816 RepID=A0A8B8MFB4_ABRPR|nr:transcription factor bHLH92 [Abrus precatorius]